MNFGEEFEGALRRRARIVLCLAACGMIALIAATALKSQVSPSGNSTPPVASAPSATSGGTDNSSEQPADDWPDTPGKAQVFQTCNGCHPADWLIGHNQDADGWSDTVSLMAQRGAQGSDEDFNAIVKYLATYFGPAPEKVNMNKATAMNLRNWLGMDETRADAIVAYRAKHGDFKTLDDLKSVPDVDAKYLDGIKDHLTFQ